MRPASLSRGAASPCGARGKGDDCHSRRGPRGRSLGVLRDRADAVLGERADALRGGDADLDGLLDAGRDAGELIRHDVRAAGRVTLDRGAVAAHDALQPGARLLDVALELVAGLHAAALVARLQL